MKYLLALICLLLPTISIGSQPFDVVVKDIYDGDTFRIELPLPEPLNKAYVRIRGVDTPEKGARAKCASENEKSKRALARVKELIAIDSIVTLQNYDWDKYGGRIDAQVISKGVDVGAELLKEHLASSYNGQGAKKDWCSL